MIYKTKRSFRCVKDQKKLAHIGIHLICDFWYGKDIKEPDDLKNILIKAVKAAKSTPLDIAIHKFSPQGITGIIILAESHISIHTWPECNYIAIDIFTCGTKSLPYKALDCFKKEFQPKKVEIKEIKRGFIKI